jgi:hypothetical protein
MGSSESRVMKLSLAILLMTMMAVAQLQPSPVRVFITDQDSYHESATFTSSNGTAVGTAQGGVRRTNPEQIKTLNKQFLR